MSAFRSLLFGVMVLTAGRALLAQGEVSVQLRHPGSAVGRHETAPVALLWLEPVGVGVHDVPWPSKPPYRLLQKNKMFTPHLLVIPVGTSVSFPNADPFFHNVFSLFDGSRFDLGLYEAGNTREVRFSRKGFSYIFCNIHPEMAAIVVTLDTPLWTSDVRRDVLTVSGVPAGTYRVHLWIEGQDAQRLERFTHSVEVSGQGTTQEGFSMEAARKTSAHPDEYGHPYAPQHSPY